jgi:4-oxalocrotonate tautomerase
LFEAYSVIRRGDKNALRQYKDNARGCDKRTKGKTNKRSNSAFTGCIRKTPITTVVVIDEVDVDNWGMGGETITVFRQKHLNQ